MPGGVSAARTKPRQSKKARNRAQTRRVEEKANDTRTPWLRLRQTGKARGPIRDPDRVITFGRTRGTVAMAGLDLDARANHIFQLQRCVKDPDRMLGRLVSCFVSPFQQHVQADLCDVGRL